MSALSSRGKDLKSCGLQVRHASAASLLAGIATAILAGAGQVYTSLLTAVGSLLLGHLARRIAACPLQKTLGVLFDRHVESFLLSGLVIYAREVLALQVAIFIPLLGSLMIMYVCVLSEARNCSFGMPGKSFRMLERVFCIALIVIAPSAADSTNILSIPLIVAISAIGALLNIFAITQISMLMKEVRFRSSSDLQGRTDFHLR